MMLNILRRAGTARLRLERTRSNVEFRCRREPRLFSFVMIKPTRYDDHGSPIQWFRSLIPSNTLAFLNALVEDAKRRHVLGPDVNIRPHTYDETSRRVRPGKIIRMIAQEGGRALIGLVGVQSNRFPRGRSGAAVSRRQAAGLIGRFHVSGCIAMLPSCRPTSRRRTT